jgi:hypothetical protein
LRGIQSKPLSLYFGRRGLPFWSGQIGIIGRANFLFSVNLVLDRTFSAEPLPEIEIALVNERQIPHLCMLDSTANSGIAQSVKPTSMFD